MSAKFWSLGGFFLVSACVTQWHPELTKLQLLRDPSFNDVERYAPAAAQEVISVAQRWEQTPMGERASPEDLQAELDLATQWATQQAEVHRRWVETEAVQRSVDQQRMNLARFQEALAALETDHAANANGLNVSGPEGIRQRANALVAVARMFGSTGRGTTVVSWQLNLSTTAQEQGDLAASIQHAQRAELEAERMLHATEHLVSTPLAPPSTGRNAVDDDALFVLRGLFGRDGTLTATANTRLDPLVRWLKNDHSLKARVQMVGRGHGRVFESRKTAEFMTLKIWLISHGVLPDQVSVDDGTRGGSLLVVRLDDV